jgi:hypothetical protein
MPRTFFRTDVISRKKTPPKKNLIGPKFVNPTVPKGEISKMKQQDIDKIDEKMFKRLVDKEWEAANAPSAVSYNPDDRVFRTSLPA